MRKKGSPDSRIQDNVAELMAEGINQSLATATALDLARRPKKKLKSKKDKGQKFYETSPRKIEPNEGRVKTGRAVMVKKMRHGQY